MNTRTTASILVGLVLAVSGSLSAPGPALAAQPSAADSDPLSASLKEELEVGLKARRPADFEFIATVVGKVALKELPLDLVKSTFQWARKKQPYPFPFFERGLRLRAAQKGISL